MGDLIERDWVLKRMVFEPDYEVVQMAPAVDAEPVRHAVWDFYDYDVLGYRVRCSECGWGAKNVDVSQWLKYAGHQYCGVCGAKMDQEV